MTPYIRIEITDRKGLWPRRSRKRKIKIYEDDRRQRSRKVQEVSWSTSIYGAGWIKLDGREVDQGEVRVNGVPMVQVPSPWSALPVHTVWGPTL